YPLLIWRPPERRRSLAGFEGLASLMGHDRTRRRCRRQCTRPHRQGRMAERQGRGGGEERGGSPLRLEDVLDDPARLVPRERGGDQPSSDVAPQGASHGLRLMEATGIVTFDAGMAGTGSRPIG